MARDSTYSVNKQHIRSGTFKGSCGDENGDYNRVLTLGKTGNAYSWHMELTREDKLTHFKKEADTLKKGSIFYFNLNQKKTRSCS